MKENNICRLCRNVELMEDVYLSKTIDFIVNGKFDENNTPMVQHFEIDGVECTFEFDQNQQTLYVRNFNVDQKKYRLSNKALCILVAFALLTAICAIILYKAGCELTDLLILFALYIIIPQILIRFLK